MSTLLAAFHGLTRDASTCEVERKYTGDTRVHREPEGLHQIMWSPPHEYAKLPVGGSRQTHRKVHDRTGLQRDDTGHISGASAQTVEATAPPTLYLTSGTWCLL